MLSNSNFIIAQTCATKLYYATNKYPKNTDTNEYMAMLAGVRCSNNITKDSGGGCRNCGTQLKSL